MIRSYYVLPLFAFMNLLCLSKWEKKSELAHTNVIKRKYEQYFTIKSSHALFM